MRAKTVSVVLASCPLGHDGAWHEQVLSKYLLSVSTNDSVAMVVVFFCVMLELKSCLWAFPSHSVLWKEMVSVLRCCNLLESSALTMPILKVQLVLQPQDANLASALGVREFPNLEKSISYLPPKTYKAKGSASGLILERLLSAVTLRMPGTIWVKLSPSAGRS